MSGIGSSSNTVKVQSGYVNKWVDDRNFVVAFVKSNFNILVEKHPQMQHSPHASGYKLLGLVALAQSEDGYFHILQT